MTDKEFKVFLEFCCEELKVKQDRLFNQYNLSDYDEYFYDQSTESIKFIKDGKTGVEFTFIPVGSWSSNTGTWMWAWAMDSMTEDLKRKSEMIKGLAKYKRTVIFEEDYFEAEEYIAYELTALTVHYLSAMGMYSVPHNHLKIFIALMEVK